MHSSAQWLDFKCPHCGKIFYYDTGRYRRRKSLPPCQCELKEIEDAFELAMNKELTAEVNQENDNLSVEVEYDDDLSLLIEKKKQKQAKNKDSVFRNNYKNYQYDYEEDFYEPL